MNFEIIDNLWNIRDFLKEKIKFIYPQDNSCDINYEYITNFWKIFKCECNFYNDNCDLVLCFEKLDNDLNDDLKIALNKYNLSF